MMVRLRWLLLSCEYEAEGYIDKNLIEALGVFSYLSAQDLKKEGNPNALHISSPAKWREVVDHMDKDDIRCLSAIWREALSGRKHGHVNIQRGNTSQGVALKVGTLEGKTAPKLANLKKEGADRDIDSSEYETVSDEEEIGAGAATDTSTAKVKVVKVKAKASTFTPESHGEFKGDNKITDSFKWGENSGKQNVEEFLAFDLEKQYRYISDLFSTIMASPIPNQEIGAKEAEVSLHNYNVLSSGNELCRKHVQWAISVFLLCTVVDAGASEEFEEGVDTSMSSLLSPRFLAVFMEAAKHEGTRPLVLILRIC